MPEGVVGLGAFCCFIFLTIGCSVLGSSFDTIKPTEVGIHWNPTDNTLNTGEIYKNSASGGNRHALGPGHSFYKYSMKLKFANHMSKRLACWTKDKQAIELELGIFYKLKADGVGELFKRYGRDYWKTWDAQMQEAVRGATKNWDTTDYFSQRDLIISNITSELQYRMVELRNEQIENITVVMGTMSIPEEFEAAVTTKVVTQQEEITTLYSRNYTIVQAETSLITSEADMKVAVIKAQAQAKATKITEAAEAEAEELIQKAYAEAYAYIQTTLGLSDEQLFRYMWARSLEDQTSSASLLVGFGNSSFLDVRNV